MRALAYVKPDKIYDTFDSLPNLSFFSNLALPVYSYFFDTYINGNHSDRINHEIWNHYNLFSLNVLKINNAIEGWHNTFNSSFKSSKNNFINLISKIKDDEEGIQQKIRGFDNVEVFYRNMKYIKLEEDLINLFNGTQVHYGLDYILFV